MENIAADDIKAFIDRVERMESDKDNIMADIKELYLEVKAKGYDTKIIKKIVSIRKKNAQELKEEEELLHIYMHAIGMV